MIYDRPLLPAVPPRLPITNLVRAEADKKLVTQEVAEDTSQYRKSWVLIVVSLRFITNKHSMSPLEYKSTNNPISRGFVPVVWNWLRVLLSFHSP